MHKIRLKLNFAENYGHEIFEMKENESAIHKCFIQNRQSCHLILAVISGGPGGQSTSISLGERLRSNYIVILAVFKVTLSCWKRYKSFQLYYGNAPNSQLPLRCFNFQRNKTQWLVLTELHTRLSLVMISYSQQQTIMFIYTSI